MPGLANQYLQLLKNILQKANIALVLLSRCTLYHLELWSLAPIYLRALCRGLSHNIKNALLNFRRRDTDKTPRFHCEK